jgi:hypothetical protein
LAALVALVVMVVMERQLQQVLEAQGLQQVVHDLVLQVVALVMTQLIIFIFLQQQVVAVEVRERMLAQLVLLVALVELHQVLAHTLELVVLVEQVVLQLQQQRNKEFLVLMQLDTHQVAVEQVDWVYVLVQTLPQQQLEEAAQQV